MNDHNPYQAPTTTVADLSLNAELTGHGERLGAAIIDAIIVVAVAFPVMFMGGYFATVMDSASRGAQVPFMSQLLWGAIGIGIFYLIQGYPLSKSGQTWGKRILKIKIVDLEGRQPSFARLAGLRYLSVQIMNLIPIVGGLIAIVNVLLIFRSDRRCGHDLIAGTRVVSAK